MLQHPMLLEKHIEEVITELTNISQKLFTWFSHQMKSNHGKCHLLLSSSEPLSIQVGQKLLNQDSYVSIHYKNMQALAIEMYKIIVGTAPKVIKK